MRGEHTTPYSEAAHLLYPAAPHWQRHLLWRCHDASSVNFGGHHHRHTAHTRGTCDARMAPLTLLITPAAQPISVTGRVFRRPRAPRAARLQSTFLHLPTERRNLPRLQLTTLQQPGIGGALLQSSLLSAAGNWDMHSTFDLSVYTLLRCQGFSHLPRWSQQPVRSGIYGIAVSRNKYGISKGAVALLVADARFRVVGAGAAGPVLVALRARAPNGGAAPSTPAPSPPQRAKNGGVPPPPAPTRRSHQWCQRPAALPPRRCWTWPSQT